MRWFKRAAPREPDPDFVELLADHGLAAFERQAAFTEVVGDRDWELDQEQGVIRFGDDLSFRAQIMGSESDRSRTWLWAWANPTVEQSMAEHAAASRTMGERLQVAVLTEPEIDLQRVGEAYLLALAVTGALDADAYYPCPYPGGAAYATVMVPGGLRPAGRSIAERAALVAAGAAEQAPALLSRRSIERFLERFSAEVRTDGDVMTIEDVTTFRFDSLGRLTAIEADLGAQPESP